MGRHHARVLRRPRRRRPGRASPTPAGDPHGVAGRPARCSPNVEELIAAGIDYCMVAVPTAYHEEVGAGAGRRRRPRDDREAAGAGRPRRRTRLAEAFEAAGLVGAVGHIERYNPALQQAPHAARGRRPRRRLPGRHPPAGPVPGADRRRRRGQGPRHPRHRPDRLGDAAVVPQRRRPDRVQERSRARGPRRGRRAARRTAR